MFINTFEAGIISV